MCSHNFINYISFICELNLDWPNLIVGSILGGICGLCLVYGVDWLRKIQLKDKGFVREQSIMGELYKFKFILKGSFEPGVCCCEIFSKQGNSFAKWDETPNPLKGDDLKEFIPEMVPSTYYQNLYLNREYTIPIIIKDKEEYYIFNGWWFGKSKGYYGLQLLKPNDIIKILIRGNTFSWPKEFSLEEIKNI
jgi:hypothetical protein